MGQANTMILKNFLLSVSGLEKAGADRSILCLATTFQSTWQRPGTSRITLGNNKGTSPGFCGRLLVIAAGPRLSTNAQEGVVPGTLRSVVYDVAAGKVKLYQIKQPESSSLNERPMLSSGNIGRGDSE